MTKRLIILTVIAFFISINTSFPSENSSADFHVLVRDNGAAKSKLQRLEKLRQLDQQAISRKEPPKSKQPELHSVVTTIQSLVNYIDQEISEHSSTEDLPHPTTSVNFTNRAGTEKTVQITRQDDHDGIVQLPPLVNKKTKQHNQYVQYVKMLSHPEEALLDFKKARGPAAQLIYYPGMKANSIKSSQNATAEDETVLKYTRQHKK